MLVERILNGGDRDLQILAADGIVPLAARDITALQLSLRLSDDPEVSSRASRSLVGTDPGDCVMWWRTPTMTCWVFCAWSWHIPSLSRRSFSRLR